MRNKPAASVLVLLTLAASLAAQTACTVAAAPGSTGEPSSLDAPSAASDDAGAARPAGAGVTILAAVPTGVQCVVATVSGASNETVSASVASGASTVSLAFGALSPGTVTVSANAYNGACPATGAPTWSAEAVQATVVEGVATQIQLVFRPAGQTTTGTGIFSLPAIAIAAGPRTTYAVLSDGTVRAWGLNDAGEFGTTTPASSPTPVVVPGVTNAVQIAAGAQSACVIRTDSSVMCWGLNVNGGAFVTVGTAVNPISAAVIEPGLSASQISGAGTDLLFVGTGTNPTIGLMNTGASNPISWLPGNNLINPMSIAAAGLTAGSPAYCYVTEEGTVFCSFGAGGVAGVGAAAFGFVGAASRVFGGSENGTPFACALVDGGAISCWGANTYGELGLAPSTTMLASATGVGSPSHVTAMALSRGTGNQAHSCMVAAGVVYCVGSNQYGQLGENENWSGQTSFGPPVALLPSGIVNVVAGQAHTCALDSQGTVHCWGFNDDGEIGDGTTFTRFAPVTVLPW